MLGESYFFWFGIEFENTGIYYVFFMSICKFSEGNVYFVVSYGLVIGIAFDSWMNGWLFIFYGLLSELNYCLFLIINRV